MKYIFKPQIEKAVEVAEHVQEVVESMVDSSRENVNEVKCHACQSVVSKKISYFFKYIEYKFVLS